MPTYLRDMLLGQEDDMFNATDYEYRLFLQDHKAAVLSTSTMYYMDPDERAKYKHRPRYFLYSKNLPPASDWVLLWLNDLTGPKEFHDREYIAIPNYSDFEALYSMYRTLRTKLKKAKKLMIKDFT